MSIFSGQMWTKSALFLMFFFFSSIAASEPETIFVYGPGGPLPAMTEAAEMFGKSSNIKIEVKAGPTNQWIKKARKDADVIYSGSEHMMTDFVDEMKGRIDEKTIYPLYMRPMAILVRPGNPKGISDFPDLLKPGIKIIVVQGAGQTGIWEDIAGRKGDIETVRQFRKNIAAFAPNSAEAKKIWTGKKDLDAWLIYNIWQVSNPQLADMVPLSSEWVLYRDCGIALTQKGNKSRHAREFLEFVKSPEGAKIFRKWGWITE